MNGRGAACSIAEWGTGTKLHIDFNTKWKWKPIKENAQKFSTQLVVIAQNARKVPLTKISWSGMPNHIIDDIWKDVQVNNKTLISNMLVLFFWLNASIFNDCYLLIVG